VDAALAHYESLGSDAAGPDGGDNLGAQGIGRY
jgi:hypothetical protein